MDSEHFSIMELTKNVSNDEVEEIINLGLYELYGDKKYITSAYERIKKQINNLHSDKIDIFLFYPIPKKIIEEYNKVFS